MQFCFIEDEEHLGFEIIEKRINETHEINNGNKEKYIYLFNMKINRGIYDYEMNKNIKESNKGLNMEEE